LENIDFKKILEEIKPVEEESKRVKSLSNKLVETINDIAKKNDIDAEAVLVGSVAKGTWLHGKGDIDIFIKFPLNLDEEHLKEYGLFLGFECVKSVGGKYELRYASHPYVTGFVEGFDIDFVPCYPIKSAEELKSAVDRTILHTKYIKKNLKQEQKDEVLLLKKFMESIHTYSAEFKIGGFSGYLCELLIICYGSFLGVLKASADEWGPDYIIDLENYGTGEIFNEPLVVIDPTDKNRNVAAALTLQKLSEFIIASRNFLNNPKKDYFSEKELKVDLNAIKDEFKQRETKTFLINFRPPEIPADSLHPQIKKTELSLSEVLEREDFSVFNTDSWTDERQNIIILLELDVWDLPTIKKHYGPYIWSKEHQDKFLSKYGDKAYVEGDRWVTEIEREYKDAEFFIEDILAENKIGLLRFGKHIKNEILKEHYILDILELLESSACRGDMLLFFYEYLNKNVYLSR